MKLNPFALMRRESDKNGIVFDPENNKAMTLNATGVLIWEAIDKGDSADEIVKMLTDTFNVDDATARRDVSSFLETLKQKGLLSES